MKNNRIFLSVTIAIILVFILLRFTCRYIGNYALENEMIACSVCIYKIGDFLGDAECSFGLFVINDMKEQYVRDNKAIIYLIRAVFRGHRKAALILEYNYIFRIETKNNEISTLSSTNITNDVDIHVIEKIMNEVGWQ